MAKERGERLTVHASLVLSLPVTRQGYVFFPCDECDCIHLFKIFEMDFENDTASISLVEDIALDDEERFERVRGHCKEIACPKFCALSERSCLDVVADLHRSGAFKRWLEQIGRKSAVALIPENPPASAESPSRKLRQQPARSRPASRLSPSPEPPSAGAPPSPPCRATRRMSASRPTGSAWA